MPIVKVFTSLAMKQLPKNFMQNFGQELSIIMGKPVGKFHWRLQTDQPISILVIPNLTLDNI